MLPADGEPDPVKDTIVEMGVVPATCEFPGMLLQALILMDGDPCAGCNHDRTKCGGRPRQNKPYKPFR